MSDESHRIQESDCLYALLRDLQTSAVRLDVRDAAARESWLRAAGDLLAQVPDRPQRLAWGYTLAATVPGVPTLDILAELTRRTEEVWRCA